MPLSSTKLHELFLLKGYAPTKYFVQNGFCFYVELLSRSGDLFLLYIPSKYEIIIKNVQVPIYSIETVELNKENDFENYTGKPDETDVEAVYGNEPIELSPDGEKIEDHLVNHYKRKISIARMPKDVADDIRALFRQMERLSFCVQNLDYKLAVIYRNYIISIRRDETVSCFKIKNYKVASDTKKMLVVADLETFYDKNEKLIDDIHIVRDSIYRVLERNQGSHGRTMQRMIENKKDIAVLPTRMEVKKLKYDTMLNQLQLMLDSLNESQNKLIEESKLLEDKNGVDLQGDINRVHQKTKLEAEIHKINDIKGEITKTMVAIRDKRENSILNIDKIMFDNTVMFDRMVKNFARLKDFC